MFVRAHGSLGVQDQPAEVPGAWNLLFAWQRLHIWLSFDSNNGTSPASLPGLLDKLPWKWRRAQGSSMAADITEIQTYLNQRHAFCGSIKCPMRRLRYESLKSTYPEFSQASAPKIKRHNYSHNLQELNITGVWSVVQWADVMDTPDMGFLLLPEGRRFERHSSSECLSSAATIYNMPFSWDDLLVLAKGSSKGEISTRRGACLTV